MSSLFENHYIAAKGILRYVKGTTNYGVWYFQQKECKLVGYTNSDWASSKNDMKSTLSYLFSLDSRLFS